MRVPSKTFESFALEYGSETTGEIPYSPAHDLCLMAANVALRLYSQEWSKARFVECGIINTEMFPNALCRKLDGGKYVIGFFSTLLLVISEIAALITNRSDILLREDVQIDKIKVDEKLSYPWGFEFVFGREFDPNEWLAAKLAGNGFLFDYVFLCMIEFAVHHEFGHLKEGHLDFYHSQFRVNTYSENAGNASTPSLDATRLVCEIDADATACAYAATHALYDFAPKSTRRRLAESGIPGKEALYSIKFASNILTLWAFNMAELILHHEQNFDLEKFFRTWSNYPSPLARVWSYKQNVILLAKRDVAEEKARTRLLPEIWSDAEKILRRLEKFNPWFSPVVYGLSPSHTDKTRVNPLHYGKIRDALSPYAWD
jgi:hypothetical protein